MAISDEDIARVREASDIVELFRADVNLVPMGREWKCCCPFHAEKTPSCKINPDMQSFYCFGCHESGDVFTYVMKRDGVGFLDAVRFLAEKSGIELAETRGNGLGREGRNRLKMVCEATADFYHQQLMRGKSEGAAAARSYLAGRGMGGSIPKTWKLGYAPGRGALVKHLQSLGFTVKEMVDANVAVSRDAGRVNDRFYERVMFPIFDAGGECIAFGGRVLGSGEPKYLNSQDTPLFHKSNVLFGLDKAKASMTATGTAIVVEGYTDVIMLHAAGVANAVATLGTALTRSHIRLLSRHAGRRIVYLFDGDEAGQRAADRALGFIGEWSTPEAGRKQVELVACTLPDKLDPADFIAQRGADELRALIEGAKPLIAYGIDRCLARFDTSSAEGRAQAFAEAIALLAPIKDSVLASDYAVQIASRLRIREDEAIARLKSLKARAAAPEDAVPAPEAVEEPRPRAPLPPSERNRQRIEGVFLGLCAKTPTLALEHAQTIAQTAWHSPLCARIAESLLDILATNPQIDPSELLGRLTQEHPQTSRLLAASSALDAGKQARFLAEELEMGDLEDAIQTYQEQLRQIDASQGEDYDMLAKTVLALQKDLAARRAAHVAHTM